MKTTVLFPLVWTAVFAAWYFLSGHLLARDADLFLALRERGERVNAVVVERMETRRSPGKSDERIDYALRLRIKVSSGQSSDVRLGVDKGRYDAQPQDSTIAVVAMAEEPSRYMQKEDFEHHGPDGMREDASRIRWVGGFLVSTIVAGLVAVFRRKPTTG